MSNQEIKLSEEELNYIDNKISVDRVQASKLIAEIRRLQPIESSLELAVKALERFEKAKGEFHYVWKIQQYARETLDQIRRVET